MRRTQTERLRALCDVGGVMANCDLFKEDEVKSTALEVVSPEPMALQAVPTPMSMIQLALQQNASVEVLRDLFKLKQEVEADEARKAFHDAMAQFKANAPRIEKNISVTAGPLSGKKYADLYAVVSAIASELSRYGLSHTWKPTKDAPDWIEMTCTITHRLGFSQSVAMGGPPDTGGAKNAIQARASTVTYLERYTLLAAVGMATAGTENDGNGAGPQMDEKAYSEWCEEIRTSGSEDELRTRYMAAIAVSDKVGDKTATLKFGELKNLRFKELRAKGATR